MGRDSLPEHHIILALKQDCSLIPRHSAGKPSVQAGAKQFSPLMAASWPSRMREAYGDTTLHSESVGKLSESFQYLGAIQNIHKRCGIGIFEDHQIGATAQHRRENDSIDAANQQIFSDVL